MTLLNKNKQKKAVIKIMPLISENLNIFSEIPLENISRNYNYKIISINWITRKKGVSKFKIKEPEIKYLLAFIYCFIEKNLLKIKKWRIYLNYPYKNL